jgi:hypothetical protein
MAGVQNKPSLVVSGTSRFLIVDWLVAPCDLRVAAPPTCAALLGGRGLHPSPLLCDQPPLLTPRPPPFLLPPSPPPPLSQPH